MNPFAILALCCERAKLTNATLYITVRAVRLGCSMSVYDEQPPATASHYRIRPDGGIDFHQGSEGNPFLAVCSPQRYDYQPAFIQKGETCGKKPTERQ